MHRSVLFACAYVLRMQCPERPGKGTKGPRTRATGSCEPPCGCWKQNQSWALYKSSKFFSPLSLRSSSQGWDLEWKGPRIWALESIVQLKRWIPDGLSNSFKGTGPPRLRFGPAMLFTNSLLEKRSLWWKGTSLREGGERALLTGSWAEDRGGAGCFLMRTNALDKGHKALPNFTVIELGVKHQAVARYSDLSEKHSPIALCIWTPGPQLAVLIGEVVFRRWSLTGGHGPLGADS